MLFLERVSLGVVLELSYRLTLDTHIKHATALADERVQFLPGSSPSAPSRSRSRMRSSRRSGYEVLRDEEEGRGSEDQDGEYELLERPPD